MRLTALKLVNFRNHLESSFTFGSGTNVLLGDNGQGKTNVIEAISYLCLTKSFYAGSDHVALHFGQDMFEVKGALEVAGARESRVRVAFADGAKAYTINRHPIEPLSSVIGKFPVVIFSPEHAPITTGGPVERRRFMDFVISQSSASYFHDLLEYRKVLRQRNKILLDARIARRDPGTLLEPWTEQLVKLGGALMTKRMIFVREFQSFISSAYHHLVGVEEEPMITYQPLSVKRDDQLGAECSEILRNEVLRKEKEEKRLGTTLVGPHRDELECTINGIDLRKYASQGQHKTFLIALKIGEFFYLKERCSETPILLLDDVFTELDERRAKQLLSFVDQLSQTFITSTSGHPFDHLQGDSDRNRIFRIERGKSVEQQIPVVL